MRTFFRHKTEHRAPRPAGNAVQGAVRVAVHRPRPDEAWRHAPRARGTHGGICIRRTGKPTAERLPSAHRSQEGRDRRSGGENQALRGCPRAQTVNRFARTDMQTSQCLCSALKCLSYAGVAAMRMMHPHPMRTVRFERIALRSASRKVDTRHRLLRVDARPIIGGT